MSFQSRPNDLLRGARLARRSPSGSGRPMSRQELADAVNAHLFEHAGRDSCIDAAHIGRLERGQHRWPAAHYRAALRAVLDTASDADLGFFINRPPTVEVTEPVAESLAPGSDAATGVTFAARLRDLRVRRGHSIRGLGRLAFYSHSHLWDLEHGHKRPTAAVASALDRALDAGGELAALATDLDMSHRAAREADGGVQVPRVGPSRPGATRARAAAGPAVVRVHVSAGVEVTVVCDDGASGRVAVLAAGVRVLIDASGTDPGSAAPAVADAQMVAGGARVFSLARWQAKYDPPIQAGGASNGCWGEG